MSATDAVAFLERLETDEGFAAELESVRDRPDAVLEKVRAAGFDTDPEEIQGAFSDRYGVELTPEQLDGIAAGLTTTQDITVGLGVGGFAMVGAAVAASF